MPHHRALRSALWRQGRRVLPALASLSVAIAIATPALAAGGHQHGVAALDVAVDGSVLSVALRIPMDSLVGFERAPQSPAQRQAMQEATVQLRQAASLFVLAPPGACTLEEATVRAPNFESEAARTAKPGHADVEADYRWRCASGARPDSLEVKLFSVFTRLRRVEARTVSSQGQRKTVLRPTQALLRLDRPR